MGKQSGDLGEVSFVLMKRIVKLEMGVREECVCTNGLFSNTQTYMPLWQACTKKDLTCSW